VGSKIKVWVSLRLVPNPLHHPSGEESFLGVDNVILTFINITLFF
jgi:hypothetical protein